MGAVFKNESDADILALLAKFPIFSQMAPYFSLIVISCQDQILAGGFFLCVSSYEIPLPDRHH